jgi:F420-dependent methylenetetrahydromethanopterin dehydrogenase
MTLFTYEDSEIIDAVKKSGAYIFEPDWTSKIEIIAQVREDKAEEISIEDAKGPDVELMKVLGKTTAKKLVYERLTYILRSRDTIFGLEAIEDLNNIKFNFFTTDKVKVENLKGMSAIAQEQKYITIEDISFMFKRPTDFTDECLKDAMYCNAKDFKKYLVDRHGDLFDEELIEVLGGK